MKSPSVSVARTGNAAAGSGTPAVKTAAPGRAATRGRSEERRIDAAACLCLLEPIWIILRHDDPKWVKVLRIELFEQL